MPLTDRSPDASAATVPAPTGAAADARGESGVFYATCAAGLERLLAEELAALGLPGVRRAGSGASFGGDLESGYRACLGSRVASRVLMALHEGAAASPEALYARVGEIDWGVHLDVDGTLAVDAFTARSAITHSRYAALKVKDAIVDQFRERHGRRPSVERETPDLRVNVYVYRDRARIAIDLSGPALHRRGYREAGGAAPLKENLAAALLLAAGWPALAEEGVAFADPLCGSGTLLVEAATIACRRAPGLDRAHFGFLGWKGHDAPLWTRLVEETRAAVRAAPGPLAGGDRDPAAVEAARRHAANAGVADAVTVETRALGDGRLAALADVAPGLLVTNPPYGGRLAADAGFYRALGEGLAAHYDGWRCAVFTAREAPLAAVRLALEPRLEVANGGIDCVLAAGTVPAWSGAGPEAASRAGAIDVGPFVNRLTKNRRALRGWRRAEELAAWRVYDADLPEFAVAIDLYETVDDGRHAVVQEYRAPRSVNAALAAARLEALLAALPGALDVDPARVHLKRRERQSGASQYRRSEEGESVIARIEERGCRLELNFSDYLDVGLFPDHRTVRRWVGERAAGGRFLNLFAYTGAASVAAVVGGARASVSVDLSKRYCRWAERNLAANGADPAAHRVVRADVARWLRESADEAPFDVILLDPPTYSNSSDLAADWDVQRDHVGTIAACLERLAPTGLLVFSNNYRRFRLDAALADGRLGARRLRVEERTRASIGRDFRRSPRIHRVWFVEPDPSADEASAPDVEPAVRRSQRR